MACSPKNRRPWARIAAVSASALLCALAGASASAQVTDTTIPLNYNFHGMAHGFEAITPANNANADVINYRSISDRGLYFDTTGADPRAFGSLPLVGTTGITYAAFNAAGWSNSTQPNAALYELDMVHLGNRAISNAFEASVNTATNRGIFPAWAPDALTNCDHTVPQVTTLGTPIVIDAGTEIGVLYHASNSGGQFDVVLGFSDATTATARLAAPDWFGVPADPAILANQPVTSQRKMVHNVAGTNYSSYRGVDNLDAATLQAATTGVGPNLNVIEAVISVPRIITAGNNIAGKTLTSISFQNATYPAGTARGYAIFAASIRKGQPVNAVCASATPVTTGDTTGNNGHTFGAPVSSCGANDSSALWYSYVATATGNIEARTCGASFDTTLSIYTSCGGPAIACNDNGCGTSSRVTWQATIGQPYLIRVAGNAGATGSFTLHIDDPAHTDIPTPLNYNFNGIVQGPSEYGIAAPAPNNTHENRADLNGYRSLADRGLLVDGSPTSINFGGTVSGGATGTGISYQIATTPLQPDVVYIGDRNFVANGARAFALSGPPFANNNGLQPIWFPNSDQTGPQVSSMTGLGAVLGTNTRIGFLYHMSDFGGSFDCVLTFTDLTSATVTLRCPDWFGDRTTAYATLPLGAGVALHRQLGVFNAVDNTDNDKPVASSASYLNVTEAVVDRNSLLSGLGFDIAGKTLSSITFQNAISNATYTNPGATPSNRSGLAIMAATIRDPASVSLNFNPTATGTVTPNQLPAHATGLMTVTVTPGTGTPNNTVSVTVDGSSAGLASNLALFDNGTNGDLTAGDNTWSRNIAFPINSVPGVFQLPFDAVDAQNRHATGNIIFTLTAPTGFITPATVIAGDSGLATFNLGPNNGTSTDITSASIDGSPAGLGSIFLNDSGSNGDVAAADGIWSATIPVPGNALGGTFVLPASFSDAGGRMASGSVGIAIVGPPVATDLGTIGVGITTSNVTINPATVSWLKFTLANPIDASLLTFFDIDTEGSTLSGGTTANDSIIGLYTAAGALVNSDDDDGTDFLSQLTYGVANPARPAPGNGQAYNGRDNALLAAGTYYLAVSHFATTFGATNWTVTTAHTGSGNAVVNFRIGTVPAGGPPASFTELGSIAVGTPVPTSVTSTQLLSSGGVQWFRFTVPATVDGSLTVRQYFDIDTEGSAIGDTVIGLFADDGLGTLIKSDDDDGSATYSQISYGRGTRAAVGDGLAYNGRDGITLAAGTYYLAVAEKSAAFGNNFIVFFNTGVNAGNITANLRSGVQSPFIAGPINNPVNNHDYYLLDTGFNFDQAEALAVSELNAHLATIDDFDENEFVRASVLGFDGADRRAWIGFTDAAAEGNFAWTDGSPVNFTNWSAGEPNNANGNENYAEMLGANGLWNDIALAGAVAGDFAVIEVGSTCIADFNNSGAVTVQDIFDFLNAYFNADIAADVNDSGTVTVQDIFDFLNAYFLGCP